jgi:hypothetical protein
MLHVNSHKPSNFLSFSRLDCGLICSLSRFGSSQRSWHECRECGQNWLRSAKQVDKTGFKSRHTLIRLQQWSCPLQEELQVQRIVSGVLGPSFSKKRFSAFRCDPAFAKHNFHCSKLCLFFMHEKIHISNILNFQLESIFILRTTMIWDNSLPSIWN